MSKFKVGDKVLINKNSTYYTDKNSTYYIVSGRYNPIDTVGKVIAISSRSRVLNIRVLWSTGKYNTYSSIDLDLQTTKKKRKHKLKNLKQFHELEEGNFYRLLHGGDVDHGYDYQLVNGILRNVSKNKNSSVPFNTSTRFLETTQSLFKFDSLDHDVVFQDSGIKVGCQNLSIKDAKEIAFQILDRY
jgi:hypothetical protein